VGWVSGADWAKEKPGRLAGLGASCTWEKASWAEAGIQPKML
jgi:hypothetical protein